MVSVPAHTNDLQGGKETGTQNFIKLQLIESGALNLVTPYLFENGLLESGDTICVPRFQELPILSDRMLQKSGYRGF